MMKTARILAICALSTIPVFATSAYMTDSADQFGTLDLTTGVFTPIGTISNRIYGMSFSSNGTLYATSRGNPADVYTIDPSTGASTLIGPTGYSAIGSALGPNGFLYALTNDQTSSAFYTIDTSTLATHVINPSLGFPSYGLSVFSGGDFYTAGYVSGNSLLFQIDPVTGLPTQIGSGIGAPAVSGTLVGNTIYAIGTAGNTPILGTISTTTGGGTLVSYVTGMAAGAYPDSIAYDNVPEPATALLMALCLPFLAVIYRARRRA